MPFAPALRCFEMWMTPEEFRRCLTLAFPVADFTWQSVGACGTDIEVRGRWQQLPWIIRLALLPERVLTELIRCPRLQADIELCDWPEEQVAAFMRHFHRSFQRGGG